MTTWEPVDIYAQDPKHKLAVLHLSEALYRGELALLLGSGVSVAFGLPGWVDLVHRCLDTRNMDKSRVTNGSAFEVMTSVIGQLRTTINDDGEYLRVVKKALYQTATDRASAAPSDLLIAMGALLMGSRRGKIREVWSLNFDDLLEWHLRIHGFVSQIVTEVPTVLRDVDVVAFHPHGFLPLDTDIFHDSKSIVFDDKTYAKRFVGTDPWRDAFDYALKTRIFIALGLSWGDQIVKNLVINAADSNKERPTAFWFFKDSAENRLAAEECLRHNVVPIVLKEYSDYSPFLLNICKTAMDKIAF